MNYPLISEYINAIESAADNFATLTNLRPVMTADGKPYMSSGNFAVVFKMKDEVTGKLYAVKCFTKEEKLREKSYRLISTELADVRSPYLISITYLEKELYVYSKNSAETEFPVLLMDWVEGKTMDVFIREHLQDQYALSLLCYNFCRIAAWLLTQPFAHGDIKPDNILVSDDASIVLVDYDGMYVSAMRGQKARELGSPDYRHPARTEKDFNEHIDDFALASIALSLKLISLDPALLDKYGAADRLLFSASDYADLSKCEVLGAAKKFSDEVELKQLIKLFIEVNGKQSISSTSSSLFNLSRPTEILPTEVTDEDLADAIIDEFGVKYSKDGKRLLKCTKIEIRDYTVRRETKVVCDGAFSCTGLSSITLPSGLTSIGQRAFSGCSSLRSITLPTKLKEIKNNPFYGSNVLQIINRSSFFRIENDLLIQGNSVIVAIGRKSSYLIPEYITSICNHAFHDCSGLTSITLPSGLSSIGDGAFSICSSLRSIILPSGLSSIGVDAFSICSSLRSITLPSKLKEIKANPFSGCNVLQIINRSSFFKFENDLLIQGNNIIAAIGNKSSYTIPDYITSIGDKAFCSCKSLTSITLPSGLRSIGNGAFAFCESLTSITLPSGLTSLGYSAFYRCWDLMSITLPSGLTSIGKFAFSRCSSLTSITLPSGLTSIGKDAFEYCSGLTSIILPSGLTLIGDGAFSGCSRLTSISFPSGLTSIGDSAFDSCYRLEYIYIKCSSNANKFLVMKKFNKLLPSKLYNRIIIQ